MIRRLHPFHRHWPLRTVLCACFVLAACGSDPTEPDVGALAGLWEATDLVVTNQNDPQQSMDLIAAGGALTLNIEPSGYYTLTLDFQGTVAPPELGIIRVEGDQLIIDVQVSGTGPRVDTATYSVSGDQFTLEGPTLFDFDFDAQAEEAWLDATFQRDSATDS